MNITSSLNSATAAAYLKYFNISNDWSVRNNTLFCTSSQMKSLYIPAPYAALSVTLLHSATKILKQGPSHTSSPQLLDSIQTSGSVSYGRTKQYKYGLEIRNNFNDMKCNNKKGVIICKYVNLANKLDITITVSVQNRGDPPGKRLTKMGESCSD